MLVWMGSVWMYLSSGYFLPTMGEKGVGWAIDIISASALLSVLYGLFALWGGGWQHPLVGTFYWHNPMASFLVVVFFPFFSRIFGIKLRAKATYTLVGFVMIFGLLLTRSRGGILAFLLAAGFWAFRFLFTRWKRKNFFPLLLFFAGLFGLVLIFSQVFPQLFAGVWQRFIQFPTAIIGRWTFFKAAWLIFLSHPWVGIGWGNFSYFYPKYQPNLDFFSTDVHNIFLQFLAEGGLFSTLLAFLFLAVVLWELRAQNSSLPFPLLVGLEASIVGGFLHSLIDFDWLYPSLMGAIFYWLGLRNAGRMWIPLPRLKWVFTALTGFFFLLATGMLYGEILHKKAVQEWEKGNPEAVNLMKLSSRIPPSNIIVWLDLAQVAYIREDRAGLDFAKNSVRINPSHPVGHQLYAKFLWRLGDLQSAEREFREALRLDPWNRPYLYLDLAKYYMESGDWEKADSILEEALKRYPFRSAEEVNAYRLNWGKIQMNKVVAEMHFLKAFLLESTGKSGAEKHREWGKMLQ